MGKDFTLNVSKCYFTHRGRVYLIRRADNGAWEPPGGCAARGETMSACAVREAKEEIGIDGKVLALHSTRAEPHPTKKGLSVREHHALMQPTTRGQEPTLDPKEVAEAGWFTLEEALALEPRGNMSEEMLRWALRGGR